jgi:thiamine monophosphate synthase
LIGSSSGKEQSVGFNPQQYNNQFLANRQADKLPLNDAADRYGVRIEPAQVKVGETYWQVHGGVDLENKNKLISAGADVLVAGNTVFGSKNPKETISLLKK